MPLENLCKLMKLRQTALSRSMIKKLQYSTYTLFVFFLFSINKIDGSNLNNPNCTLDCTDAVTIISQKVTTTIGSGSGNIPSIVNLNIPSGNSRAVFILVNFERSHCQGGDNCTSSNSSGIGLGDNYACPTALSNIYQITGRFTGTGGSMSRKNPLNSPDGDLRFGFQYGFPTPPSPNFGATYYSRESFFIAIYESEINTILDGNTSGQINITLPDVTTPKDAADEAIMYAFVFDNVLESNLGIVRSGVNTNLDNITTAAASLSGNYSMSISDLDNGQEPDEQEDGLLVLGVSGLGASNTGGFNNITGYTKVAENILNNTGGNFTTYNEGDGLSAAVFFRNGFSSGIINNVSVQSSAPSWISSNGGMLFSFTIESCFGIEDCANNIDDDGDGLIDCADSGCQPTISNVAVTQPICANKTDGQIVINAAGSGTLFYSVSNEVDWKTSNTFTNLGVGQYTIRIRNGAGCIMEYANNPVVLDIPTCLEICNDSVDNDGDGLVDCDDPDCKNVGSATSIDSN